MQQQSISCNKIFKDLISFIKSVILSKMVKTQPFRGFTLPAEFFQNYLENNTENITLKENKNKLKDSISIQQKQ